MNSKLVYIQPKELEFIFELKKQSSCTVQLANNTHHHVAFKVKTTSPKKYCVRPNVGIILPRSTSEFSVIMQAQRTAPPDMVCRDKFLIQSTIVPSGTTEEDITPTMFSKEGGKYIEEEKLKVALISPPDSPLLSPINGALKKEVVHEGGKLIDQSGPLRDVLVATHETPNLKDHNGTSEEAFLSEGPMLRNQNRPSKERVHHEASRLEYETVALKGGRPYEALKSRDQNGALKDGLPHEALKLSDQNEALKDGLPHEALKLNEQNGALKEELTHGALKISDENGALEGLARGISHLNDQYLNKVTINPLPFIVEGLANESTHKASKLSDQNGAKEELTSGVGVSNLNDQLLSGVDIHPRKYIVSRDVDESQELNNDFSNLENISEVKQAAKVELMRVNEVDQLIKGIDEIKSKLNEIELKLGEAQVTISMLSEERRSSVQEIRDLRDKLVELSRRDKTSLQVGFPPLFICMVALICIVVGHILCP